MISKYHMLTAAHVIYKAEYGGMPSRVTFQPQRYGALPTYTAYGSRWYVPNEYISNNPDKPSTLADFRADYAVVNLDRAIGNVTGWLDVESYDSYMQAYPQPPGSLPGLNMAGYPGDRPNPETADRPKGSVMYVSSGDVDEVTSDFLRFEPEDECFFGCTGADWAAGQSGGPIWIRDVRDPSGRHQVGIISNENTSSGNNYGLKITNGILSAISSIMNVPVTPGVGIIGGNANSDAPPDLPDLAGYDAFFGTQNDSLLPSSLRVNETLSASVGVTNTGTRGSSSVPMAFYLSSDPTITSSDILLGSTSVAPIGAFSSATVGHASSIPFVAPGQYYYGWIIDPAHTQSEYVRSDNVGSFSSTITINPIPADFNGDGSVNNADYVVWRKNASGLYTPADFEVWRANFGRTAFSGSGSELGFSGPQSPAVPEPGSIATSIIGMFIMMSRRRRRDVAR